MSIKAVYFLLLLSVAPVYADFSSLRTEMAFLQTRDDDYLEKKVMLFGLAINRFESQKLTSSFTTYRLKDPSQVLLHLQAAYQEREAAFSVVNRYFDYAQTEGHEDYWVDFANTFLGGGCFTHGFVQEEVMVHEMPELANLIASHLDSHGTCTIRTREGKGGPGEGDPNPYLLKGLHRVQAIDNQLAYGGKLDSLDLETLIATTKEVDPAQVVNILAIAAPYLSSRENQWKERTLRDIYNTLVAGVILLQEQATKPFVLHSGRFGCGAFNNNREAVYLLHRLLASQHGVSLKLYDYSENERAEYDAKWAQLVLQFRGKTVEECIHILSNSHIKLS